MMNPYMYVCDVGTYTFIHTHAYIQRLHSQRMRSPVRLVSLQAPTFQMRFYLCTHVYIHTHTHTYIHTFIHTYSDFTLNECAHLCAYLNDKHLQFNDVRHGKYSTMMMVHDFTKRHVVAKNKAAIRGACICMCV